MLFFLREQGCQIVIEGGILGAEAEVALPNMNFVPPIHREVEAEGRFPLVTCDIQVYGGFLCGDVHNVRPAEKAAAHLFQLRHDFFKLLGVGDVSARILPVKHMNHHRGDRGLCILIQPREQIHWEVDTPQNLYDKPVNMFVAGFIGTPQINFFSGRLTPDGKLKFANDQEITLSKVTMEKFDAKKIGEGLDVIMGIRPGDLKILDVPTETSVKARVEVVEALGNETIIYANLDMYAVEHLEKSPTSIVASAKLKKNPEKKSEIILGIDEEAIHIFDAQTEISIRK